LADRPQIEEILHAAIGDAQRNQGLELFGDDCFGRIGFQLRCRHPEKRRIFDLPRGRRDGVTEPDIADAMRKFYEIAIPAESFARMVAFAMSQPDDVDVNEILFRPTRQEL